MLKKSKADLSTTCPFTTYRMEILCTPDIFTKSFLFLSSQLPLLPHPCCCLHFSLPIGYSLLLLSSSCIFSCLISPNPCKLSPFFPLSAPLCIFSFSLLHEAPALTTTVPQHLLLLPSSYTRPFFPYRPLTAWLSVC